MAGWWWLVVGGCVGGEDPATDAVDSDGATPGCETGWLEDEGTCVPERCGRGPFGDVEADVWVDAGAAPGGDGTAGHPYATLDEAIAAAPGAVLGVAGGAYPSWPELGAGNDGLEVRGRCSELVTVDLLEAPRTRAAWSLHGSGRTRFGLHGLTLIDARTVGVEVGDARLEASDLRVERAAGIGVAALAGATLTLTDVHADGTVFDRSGAFAFGLYAYGGDVTCADCTFVDNGNGGVYAYGQGASATLTGGEVAGTGWPTGATDAWGLAVSGGGHLVATGTEVHDNANVGVWVGAGSAELEDVHVADTTPGADPANWAAGVYVEGGDATLTRVEVTRTTAEHAYVGGIAVEGGSVALVDVAVTDGTFRALYAAGAEVDADGLVVSGTRRVEEEYPSAPVSLVEGTHARLTRVVMDANAGAGLFVGSEGTTLDLDDASIAGPADAGAAALLALDGAAIDVTDLTVDGIPGWGVVLSEGAQGSVNGLDVTGVTGPDAVALAVEDGATLTLDDARIADVDAHGVLVYAGVVHAGTLSVTEVGAGGEPRGTYGVAVAAGGEMQVDVLVVAGAPGVAVAVSDEGSWLEVDEGDVSDVRSVTGESGPSGLVAQLGGTLLASDLHVHDLPGPGLLSLTDADLRCDACTVENAALAGAVALDASLALTDTHILGSGVDPSRGGGVGVLVLDGADLTLTDSTVDAQPLAALWVDGADEVHATGSSLAGGAGFPLSEGLLVHGNAVYAHGIGAWTEGHRGLELVDSTLAGSRTAVLLDDASATFSGVTWSANELDVQQQDCGGYTSPADLGLASSVLCPAYDELTLHLGFSLRLETPAAER